MKKIFILSILLALMGASAFADFGAGAEIGFDNELFYKPYYRPFTSGTYRTDENPWCFSVNLWPSDWTIVATADNWFLNEKLSDEVDWYAFWGVSGLVGFNNFALAGGTRLGIGIDWFLLDHKELELYWQIAWNPTLGFQHDGDWEVLARPLAFPFATGARWWFR